MRVTASRGHHRLGYAPTRLTRPALLSRRYSIDVVTKNWDDWQGRGWDEDDLMEVCSLSHDQKQATSTSDHSRFLYKQCTKGLQGVTRRRIYHEYPVVPRKPTMNLPDPRRYVGFNYRWASQPPYNTETYLDLGCTTIKNKDFLTIGVTSMDATLSAWMCDVSLNTALELLRRDLNCDAYSIDIADSNSAQIFYLAALNKDGAAQEYDAYRARFHDKRWIFIVINDAIGGVDYNGRKGNHWSFVCLNRARKLCHYYDSISMTNRGIGCDVAVGLLQILGENETSWTFSPEYHSPNQLDNNLFKFDVGACGPFVYHMMKALINIIRFEMRSDREAYISLHLNYDFPENFGQNFHSQEVRRDMQNVMIRWKCYLNAVTLMNEHDRATVSGENTTLVPQLPDVFFPPRSFPPVRREHSQESTSSVQTTHHGDTLEPRSDDLELDVSDPELSEASNDSTGTIELDAPDISMNDVDTDMDVEQDQGQRQEQHADQHGEEHQDQDEESGGVPLYDPQNHNPDAADKEDESPSAVTRIA